MTELTDTVDLTPATVVPEPKRFTSFARAAGGIAAIGVKELRGRMRGRRAFAIITIYLVLLGGFALMAERLVEANASNGFGGTSAFASAQIGQGIFAALLMLMTLQVVFLASSSTAGSISLEREKQTLELLLATPISSPAIVVGKLLSALVYVFLLIAASIPLMAVVFVYGGVGPEDVLRGYIVLVAAALGLGSFGLLCSSLVKRTTAATAITIFGVLAVTIGTIFVLGFWQAIGRFDENGNREGLFGIRSPAILAYLNPFVAQADVMCGTESTFGGGWCSIVSGLVPSNDGIIFTDQPVPDAGAGGDARQGIRRRRLRRRCGRRHDRRRGDRDQARIGRRQDQPVGVALDPAQVQPFDVQRDFLWPKSVVTWLILSVVFLLLSVQAVSPDASLAHPPAQARRSEPHRMTRRFRLPFVRRASSPSVGGAVIPPDPRQHLAGELDPSIEALRASLAPHRRRLWLRRMVRRAWIALAGVVVAEAILWTLARFIPLEAAPVIGAAIPIIGVLALLAAVVQARPSLGETALAVDAEGHLGDRVSSALELAVGFPASATPPAEDASLDVPHEGPFDEAVEADRFVRRQRRDALVALRTVPSLFKPRFSRSPALTVHGFGRAPRGRPPRAESPGPGDRSAA